MIGMNVTEMDDIVEYVARKITLDQDKKEEILSIAEKKNSNSNFEKFYKKLKDDFYINEYDTPEKQLALKDASILIMACICGKIDANEFPDKIKEVMVSVIAKGKFEQDLLEYVDQNIILVGTEKISKAKKDNSLVCDVF